MEVLKSEHNPDRGTKIRTQSRQKHQNQSTIQIEVLKSEYNPDRGTKSEYNPDKGTKIRVQSR
jgi:hypothetical protein